MIQSGRQRRAIFFALMSGTFMASLDSSIVNVSIPTMMADLHCSVAEIEWIVTSYILAFAVIIPAVNWLRERLGFSTLYIAALACFLTGSSLCSMAHDLHLLILARVLQGLGGGALTPTALAILSTIYPPAERGRAIGIWGLGVVIGPAIGPTLGGYLTQHFGWPSIFLINVPVGIAGLICAAVVLRSVTAPRQTAIQFDLAGFLSLSIALIAGLLSVTEIEQRGFHAFSQILLGLAIISFLAFLSIERLQTHDSEKLPLIQLGLFTNIQFRACIVITFTRSAALMGGVFLLPFLLQEALRYSETTSGLIMFPGSALVACMMPFAGRYADQHGGRGITRLGLLLVVASMSIFAYFNVGATLIILLVAMCLRGIGLGLLVTPISTATVNSVRQDQVTSASSLSSLAQQIGGAMGVSVMALIHETVRRSALISHHSALEANATALSWSFAFSALLVASTLWPARHLAGAGELGLAKATDGGAPHFLTEPKVTD